MKVKKKKETGALLITGKTLTMIAKMYPPILLLMPALGLGMAAAMTLQTLFKQSFFDKATLLAGGNAGMGAVLLALLLLGLVTAGNQILNALNNFLPNMIAEKIGGRLTLGMHEKMARLPAEAFEHPEKLDDIEKAEEGMGKTLWFSMILGFAVLFYIPYFLLMGWYLYSLKPILALSIVLVFVPVALTQLIKVKVFSKLADEAAPLRRQMDHFEDCIVGRTFFKETRVLGAVPFFKGKFMQALRDLNRRTYRANRKTKLAETAVNLLTAAGYAGILWLLFDALMQKDITVGAFAAVLGSVGMLFGVMEELIGRHLGTITAELGPVRNYHRFLQMEERNGTKTETAGEGIVLEHVSYAYPKALKDALTDVSMTLRPGETLAVVGENGSGKSTLVRILTGIYLPTEGRVLHGGVETSELASGALFEETSAVFQKYGRYQMTLAENLALADTKEAANLEKLAKAAEKAGISPQDSAYPQGFDTMLSREFDGVDLSGGQWQKVAIARAFYKNSRFILLDEPTAAIDPLEETRVYERFSALSKGKTAVIVTHRLGSVRLADRIIVLKEGRIVEIGRHDGLMAQNGEYARMYQTQEQWYSANA